MNPFIFKRKFQVMGDCIDPGIGEEFSTCCHFVQLSASAELLLERVLARGRPYEDKMTLSYMKNLLKHQEDFWLNKELGEDISVEANSVQQTLIELYGFIDGLHD